MRKIYSHVIYFQMCNRSQPVQQVDRKMSLKFYSNAYRKCVKKEIFVIFYLLGIFRPFATYFHVAFVNKFRNFRTFTQLFCVIIIYVQWSA